MGMVWKSAGLDHGQLDCDGEEGRVLQQPAFRSWQIEFLLCVCVCVCARVRMRLCVLNHVQLFATPQIAAH